MSQTASIKFDHDEGVCILEFEWLGSSICGRGPDDEVPDIGDIKGWIEDKAGEQRRDLTDAEIEAITSRDDVTGWMYEAIHEAYNEGPGPDWDIE